MTQTRAMLKVLTRRPTAMRRCCAALPNVSPPRQCCMKPLLRATMPMPLRKRVVPAALCARGVKMLSRHTTSVRIQRLLRQLPPVFYSAASANVCLCYAAIRQVPGAQQQGVARHRGWPLHPCHRHRAIYTCCCQRAIRPGRRGGGCCCWTAFAAVFALIFLSPPCCYMPFYFRYAGAMPLLPLPLLTSLRYAAAFAAIFAAAFADAITLLMYGGATPLILPLTLIVLLPLFAYVTISH